MGGSDLRRGASAAPLACGAAIARVAPKMVGRVGLEPTTNALKGRCSTIELPTPIESPFSCLAARWQPTPKAFGAALPLSYQTGARLSFYDNSRWRARSGRIVRRGVPFQRRNAPRQATRLPYNNNLKRSRNEFCRRSRRKTSSPAALAAAQSRFGSSPA